MLCLSKDIVCSVGTNKFVEKEILKGQVMVRFLHVQGTMQSTKQELIASQDYN